MLKNAKAYEPFDANEVGSIREYPIGKHSGTGAIRYHLEQIGIAAEQSILSNIVPRIRDIVTFHGETVDELEKAFKEAVDDYLATCEKLGVKPNKPYSGKLTLRIPPNVHASIATAAETSGKSLNKWVADVLNHATNTQ